MRQYVVMGVILRAPVLVLACALAACESAPGPDNRSTVTPAASATASSPEPSQLAIATLPGVEIRPFGAEKGEFVFAARIVYEPTGNPLGINELWAIPTAAGAQARVVVRYPRDDIAEAWPARYLSSDGKRYAFQIDRGDGVHRIVIADVITGSLSWLRRDDSPTHDGQPVWDPTGTRIAFTRFEGGLGERRSGGIWVVNADGTGLKRMTQPPVTTAPNHIYHWTPDGRWIAFSQGDGYDFVDATSAARIHMDNVISGDASWRNGWPALIASGWETVADGHLRYIFTADAPGGARSIVVSVGATSESVGNPRWRPGADEFFYARYVGGKAEVVIRSLSGSERALPLQEIGSPAWSPDGSSIAYIGGSVQTPILGPSGAVVNVASASTEIRLIAADGTGDRLLFKVTAPDGKPGWCACGDGLTIRRY